MVSLDILFSVYCMKYNDVSLVMRSGGRCNDDDDDDDNDDDNDDNDDDDNDDDDAGVPSGNARVRASCMRTRSCARCGGWYPE